MNCLECGALHNFWPSACSDRDGNQAFLSRILNTVDKLGWKLLFSHFFRSKWSRKSDSNMWPSVVFDGFCMKWLWLAITILCMSVHVSILSWSKLDLAAAGQTWTSPFRSFVLQGTKRPPCGEKGKRFAHLEQTPSRCTTLHNSMSPTGPTLIKYRNIFLISLPTCCKCLRYVTCMLLCRLWHMCFSFWHKPISQSPRSDLLSISAMRELVSIQGGQCGNQIGAKFWEARHQKWHRNRWIIFRESIGKMERPKIMDIVWGRGTYYIATHFIL